MYTSAIEIARATDCIVFAPYSMMCVPDTLIALNRGISRLQYSTRSPTSLIDGSGGKIQVPRAMYSFRMSFWIVPRSFFGSTPCFFPTRTYIARMIGAVALIVNEVEIWSRPIPSKIRSKSSSESTATPSFPTSSSARGMSESSPICVGRSNARLRPVWPFFSRYLNRSFVLSGVDCPEYCRIVQSALRYIVEYTPRV